MPASTSTAPGNTARGNSTTGVGGRRSIVTRPATAADIEAFYGHAPNHTLKATVVDMDGKIVGVIGVAREGNIGKYFSDFHEELAPYLRSMTIMRAIRDSLRYVREYRGPVGSLAESAEGCRILNRLGFTHIEGALYGWLN